MRDFADAVTLALGPAIEGGYVDNPLDKGKETNHGVTWPVLRAAIAAKIVPPDATIKNLSRIDAITIFRDLFWNPLRCDELPYPIALVMFDAAILHGIGTAARWVQTAVGDSNVDGIIGHATIEFVHSAKTIDVVRTLSAERMRYILKSESPDQLEEFGLGWADRILNILAEALIAAFEEGDSL